MDFLPKTLGTRPRLAIELRTEGVVGARAEDAAAVLCATSRGDLARGALVPGLRPGNIYDKAGLAAAVRKVLEEVSGRHAGREGGRDVTLVVPDAAVRVLLLDFDELPGKATEALPVVRFRLKKLLPFDADDAALSYQVMANAKGSVQVLAVAMPREVLAEYEGVVRAAGYLPGAILPSTLSVLAGLEIADSAALVVNACTTTLTTAILKGGVLMLHRSVELGSDAITATTAELGDARADVVPAVAGHGELVEEWSSAGRVAGESGGEIDRVDAMSMMQSALLHETEMWEALQDVRRTAPNADASGAMDLSQAVSVAAAYFEDTLHAMPEGLLSAGTLSAEEMSGLLVANGLEGLRVREVVEGGMIEAGAVTARVPRGWLAGVRGALKN